MPSDPLSHALRAKLTQMFPPDQVDAAVALLEAECGKNLPLISAQGALGIERVRCAVLLMSEGSLEKLNAAVRLANDDWRDVLVAAGFANDVHDHLSWLDSTSHN